MRWLVRSVTSHAGIMQQRSVMCGVRLLCTTASRYAPKRSVAGTGKSNSHSSSSSSTSSSSSAFSRRGSSHSRGGATVLKENNRTTTTTTTERKTPICARNTVGDTIPGFAASTISVEEGEEEEERRLVEGDTRLAMRLLMQRHFLYQHNVRRPEERRLEEERENLRRKHRARMERIEEKTRNSKRIGSDIAVDGILPLYSRSKAKGGAAAAAAAAGAAGSWMRLNPVEAESSDMGVYSDSYNDGDGRSSSDINASALLMKPDISAYDSEHDQRIPSSEVLDEEQKRRKEELKGGEATGKLLSEEELEMVGGLTPQRVMQSQLLQDEDQDFAVEAYSSDIDE